MDGPIRYPYKISSQAEADRLRREAERILDSAGFDVNSPEADRLGGQLTAAKSYSEKPFGMDRCDCCDGPCVSWGDGRKCMDCYVRLPLRRA